MSWKTTAIAGAISTVAMITTKRFWKFSADILVLEVRLELLKCPSAF